MTTLPQAGDTKCHTRVCDYIKFRDPNISGEQFTRLCDAIRETGPSYAEGYRKWNPRPFSPSKGHLKTHLPERNYRIVTPRQTRDSNKCSQYHSRESYPPNPRRVPGSSNWDDVCHQPKEITMGAASRVTTARVKAAGKWSDDQEERKGLMFCRARHLRQEETVVGTLDHKKKCYYPEKKWEWMTEESFLRSQGLLPKKSKTRPVTAPAKREEYGHPDGHRLDVASYNRKLQDWPLGKV